MKNILFAIVVAMALTLSSVASADTVSAVFHCKLNDGKTKEDALAVNARWLKWARAKAGTDAITSSFVTTTIGDLGGFMWVDTYPDLATWAKVWDGDDPDISAAFDAIETCSNNRLYSSTPTEAAK